MLLENKKTLMVDITKNMVGKLKLNKVVFCLFVFTLLNCKKEQKVNILELAEINNYKITQTKINDSIVKINGDNENYTLEGNLNINNNSKENGNVSEISDDIIFIFN